MITDLIGWLIIFMNCISRLLMLRLTLHHYGCFILCRKCVVLTVETVVEYDLENFLKVLELPCF